MSSAALLEHFRRHRNSAPVGHHTANPVHFAAHGQTGSKGLALEVADFGLVSVPLPGEQAEQLGAMATPARFGKREQTLLDASVRDCGEFTADRLRLQWDESERESLLREVASMLGIERLDARLHSLLVYGPEQFFKDHQDTEKTAGMVGTLVLIWPSAHLGGALRIVHGDQSLDFVSQTLGQGSTLRWCAFYADCRHSISAVSEGWRVALTFDLLVPADLEAPTAPVDTGMVVAMAALFRPDGQPRQTPWVLLLDHEYSEHGLHWSLIKGRDRCLVGALRSAADELGLTVYLALAEDHQIFDAPDYVRGSEPEGDFIDRNLVLNHWLDSEGESVSGADLAIGDDCVEHLSESGPEHLYKEEYEGFMGNYGETVEYWYRRAAIVLLTAEADFRLRLRIDTEAALVELRIRALAGDADGQLTSSVAGVASELTRAIARMGREILPELTDIVAALQDESLALELLAAFKLPGLLPEDAESFVVLEKARGLSWLEQLLRAWLIPAERTSPMDTGPGFHFGPGDALALWPEPLDAFLRAGIDEGMSPPHLTLWLSACLQRLQYCDGLLQRTPPVKRLAVRSRHWQLLGQLVRALALQPAHAGTALLTDHVEATPMLYPMREFAEVLSSPDLIAQPALAGLRDLALLALSQSLAQAPRGADDHGLRGVDWCCRCSDCAGVIRWAETRTGLPLVLAMAEQRRRHVQEQLQLAGVGIGARTIKQGSPHKLVLNKPADLVRVDETERERDRRILARLEVSAARHRTAIFL